MFFLIPPNSKEGSSSFGKRAVVEETEKWKTGEHQLITESLCWCFRGVLQFRQEWQVESSWWPSSPLTFPAGIFEEKSFGDAPEWHSSLMVRSKKFSGRARRVRSRARSISCRQVLPPVHSFSRFATTQFVREEEGWLADPVWGVYGWLQVNDVKKIGSATG